MKRNVLKSFILLFVLVGWAEVQAQSSSKAVFTKAANQFISALESSDAEKFAAMYQDSVLYRDLVYQNANRYSLNELKMMFGAFLNEDSGFNLKIISKGIDVETQTVTLKIDVRDPSGSTGEYIGWYRFENGKVVEHLDVFMYPVGDLLETPLFKAYFEKEGLEVKKKN